MECDSRESTLLPMLTGRLQKVLEQNYSEESYAHFFEGVKACSATEKSLRSNYGLEIFRISKKVHAGGHELHEVHGLP